MPIYEYRCSSCGHELEALQKLAEAPLVVCPSCNADALVKLVSAAGFQLKGSGWYATDFKGGAQAGRQAGRAREAARMPRAEVEARRSTSEAKTDASPKPKTETSPRSASRPAVGGTGGTAPRRRARHVLADEALSHCRAARLGAARHHDLGAALRSCPRSTRRCCCSRKRAAGRAPRLPHPGIRRAADRS